MTTDRDEARKELWRRYDAGDVPADELEVRLQRLDAAADGDEAAVRAALDGRVPVHRRRSTRVVLTGAAVVVAVGALAAGAMALVGDDDGGGGSASQGRRGGFAGDVFVDRGVAVPMPAPVECDLPERLIDLRDEVPANPSLLSNPPFVPEGYEHDGDEAITPGNDPDLSLGVAAGDPPPEEILGRTIEGDLLVRVRGFRYASGDDANAAGQSAAASSCTNMEAYEVPDRPELYGVVVTGIIPDTVFVSAIVGERTVVVAVESEGDVEEAKSVAGAVAAAELDAIRTPPPDGVAPTTVPPAPAPSPPAALPPDRDPGPGEVFATTTIVFG